MIGHLPTTNNSLIIRDYYKGLILPSGIEYRQNNIEKAGSVLAIAIEQKQQVYSFDVYNHINFNDFSTELKKKEPTANYLKIWAKGRYKLVICTNISLSDVLNILDRFDADFNFVKKIGDIETNAIEAALLVYSVAEHVLEPKKTKKSRQLSGSKLTPQQKTLSVEFVSIPKIIRPS